MGEPASRFLRRNSIGSIPSFSARSSIAASVSAQLCGWFGARMARAPPKLVKTPDWDNWVLGTPR